MLTLRINGQEKRVLGQVFSSTYNALINAWGKRDKAKLALALHIRDYGDAHGNLHLAKELGWVDETGRVLDDVKLVIDSIIGGVDIEDVQILNDSITVIVPPPVAG